jgi:colicin import membrane protein
MQAATVELLERKGQFPSEQALAVAEAIDMAIADSQLVTVPILDARFAASEAKVDARFAAHEAKVDARFAAHEAKMDARFAACDAKMGAGFAACDAKMGAGFAACDAKMDARFAQTDARIAALEGRLDRFRLQIIIAILIGHVALGPVGIAIVEAIVKGMGRAF